MKLACFQPPHPYAGVYYISEWNPELRKSVVTQISATLSELQHLDPICRFPYPAGGKPWSKEEFVAFVVENSDEPTASDFTFSLDGTMTWVQSWGKSRQYFERLTFFNNTFHWAYRDNEGSMERTDPCPHMAMTGDLRPEWPLMDSPYRPNGSYCALAKYVVNWSKAVLEGDDRGATVAVETYADSILDNPIADDISAVQAIFYRFADRMAPVKDDDIVWRQILARRLALDLFGPEYFVDVQEVWNSLMNGDQAAA